MKLGKKDLIYLTIITILCFSNIATFLILQGDTEVTENEIILNSDLNISKSDEILGGSYNLITLEKELGDGEVTLTEVTADTLLINGGGLNSIHLVNCNINNIITDKYDESGVRIVFKGSTNVGRLEIHNNTILQGDNHIGEIKNIETLRNDEYEISLILNDVKIARLDLDAKTVIQRSKETIIAEIINDFNKTSDKILEETNYVAIFIDDDKTYDVITTNSKLLKPEDPAKEGYIFSGWFQNEELWDFDSNLVENINLISKYEKEKTDEEKDKYTIIYNTNGGTSIANKIVLEGNKVVNVAPTKAGYIFLGWFINDKKFNFDTIINEDINLIAKWEKLESYLVTFNSDGGTNASNKSVYEGYKVSKPSNPSKTGFTFSGWYNGASEYNFNNTISKNITLTAKWNEIDYEQISLDKAKTELSTLTISTGGIDLPTTADNGKCEVVFSQSEKNKISTIILNTTSTNMTLESTVTCGEKVSSVVTNVAIPASTYTYTKTPTSELNPLTYEIKVSGATGYDVGKIENNVFRKIGEHTSAGTFIPTHEASGGTYAIKFDDKTIYILR